MPLLNRKAADAANVHGPNDNTECNRTLPQPTIEHKRGRRAPTQEFTLYGGRNLMGTVIKSGPRRFTALDASGRWLGSFDELKLATRCIASAQGGDHA